MKFKKGDIEALRNNRRTIYAYGRSKDIPPASSISTDLYHVIAAFVAINERMWPKGKTPYHTATPLSKILILLHSVKKNDFY